MARTRVYLVRHGQVDGHQEKRYNGQGDVLLTGQGQLQSSQTAQYLASVPLDAVYSSDLERCLYCARLIAGQHQLEPVAEEALREVHVGEWEGRTWEELKKDYPSQWQQRINDLAHFRIPGGESLTDTASRVRPVLERVMQRHAGGHVAIVAHGGVNRIILLDAIGAPLQRAFAIEQDYGCINIIDYLDDGQTLVRLMNSTLHQNV